MLEILGVLAIVGLLSIGGMMGYTYAVNKHRANVVLGEINIISNEFATTLLGAGTGEKTLCLGKPYDDGQMVSAEYAFAYGCGNVEDNLKKCQFGELGYWITLNGVPKNVCKEMFQSVDGLNYVSEKYLNGSLVIQMPVCMERNNVLLMFNSDKTGKPIEDKCPDNTSTEGVGGFAKTVLNKKTGEILQCYCSAVNTKYTASGRCESATMGLCKTNQDCNRGYYCNITNYGSDYCTKDTSTMKGMCRNAINDLHLRYESAPFLMSKDKMYWWSANHFCQALGKSMVTLNDYGCAQTICASGCESNYGYCHLNNSDSVTTKNEDNLSQTVARMKAVYGSEYSGWTSDGFSSCDAYALYLKTGRVNEFPLNNTTYKSVAVCK